MNRSADDFAPTASWDHLRQRAKLLQQTRCFFADRDFLEVETPLLSHDTIVDRHLDPLQVDLSADGENGSERALLWLQTSPEFGMKRLLAAGATKIYQITRAFRGGERGPLHNPEFTMIEWYRVGDDMEAGMQLLDDLSQHLLQRGPAERVTFCEAFQRYAGIHPLVSSVADLAEAAQQHGMEMTSAWDQAERDAWLDWLLVFVVEPHLGVRHPTILYDYPATQAALAKVRDDGVPLAERFELYVNGIELANGYHELTDAAVFQDRTMAANAARRHDGKRGLPVDSRLAAAMQHGLPASAGVALGFDRLVMVAVGASNLSEVMAFPIDRA
jgi:lysyl-tRNA synthetase class 2